jgi:hypothetical protein
VVVILLACVGICLAKQRVLHAVLGVWVFPLAVYAASRLGKPRSPWARRFYGERNPGKHARAERRFAAGRRTDRFKERLRDAIGGTTTQEYDAKLDDRETKAAEEAARLAAAEEIKQRAKSRGARAERGS